jgi:hypothetical protein
MISAMFAASVLLLQAAPAASTAPAPALGPAGSSAVSPVTVTSKKQQAADLNPNETICHSEAVIGSLFPKKVCATRRELADRRQQDQQQAQDFQRSVIQGKQPQ